MVWEFLTESEEFKESTISAEALSPKIEPIESKKPALAVKGVKNAPDKREKARIELYILN